jgi:wyosine [tRNA(Phe)-imidazoG37] synthetase (radical SAM superfamily)
MKTEEEKSREGSDPGLRYVFGPVVSQRLGRSLGIDPLPPKTCNWNCTYCQLGRTVPLTNRRASYVPSRAVVRELEVALSKHGENRIDWVTFVGSGETLLHSDLGWMLREAKKRTRLPVAVITNGSLLSLPEVREEVSPADAVLPSLDAGTPSLFRKINRPHPGIPFREHLAGLEAFRREYRGQLLLEVMLIRDLNDTPQALSDLAAAVRRIRPDAIHLSSPHRPPAEPWVQPTDPDGLMRATSVLGSAAKVLHLAEEVIVLEDPASAMEALVAVLGRHPMSEVQLRRALSRWPDGEASRFLASLERSPRVRRVVRHGGTFWVSGAARFPTEHRPDGA